MSQALKNLQNNFSWMLSYIRVVPALFCKNLPNIRGGSGTTVNLLGAKWDTFVHPKTAVSTIRARGNNFRRHRGCPVMARPDHGVTLESR